MWTTRRPNKSLIRGVKLSPWNQLECVCRKGLAGMRRPKNMAEGRMRYYRLNWKSTELHFPLVFLRFCLGFPSGFFGKPRFDDMSALRTNLPTGTSDGTSGFTTGTNGGISG